MAKAKNAAAREAYKLLKALSADDDYAFAKLCLNDPEYNIVKHFADQSERRLISVLELTEEVAELSKERDKLRPLATKAVKSLVGAKLGGKNKRLKPDETKRRQTKWQVLFDEQVQKDPGVSKEEALRRVERELRLIGEHKGPKTIGKFVVDHRSNGSPEASG